MPLDSVNHFAASELHTGCSVEGAKQTCNEVALDYQSDKNHDNQEATRRVKELNGAHRVLNDPEVRGKHSSGLVLEERQVESESKEDQETEQRRKIQEFVRAFNEARDAWCKTKHEAGHETQEKSRRHRNARKEAERLERAKIVQKEQNDKALRREKQRAQYEAKQQKQEEERQKQEAAAELKQKKYEAEMEEKEKKEKEAKLAAKLLQEKMADPKERQKVANREFARQRNCKAGRS